MCKIYSEVFDFHGLFARFHLECCKEFPNSVWSWCCNMAMLARCTTVLSLYFKPVAWTVSVAFRTDFNFFEIAMRDLHWIARMMLDGGICLASNLISLWLCNQREVPEARCCLSTFRFKCFKCFISTKRNQRTTKSLSDSPKPQL